MTFSRTDVLSSQLARVLFGDAKFQDAPYRQDLFWIAGATDLLTGDAIGLTAKGVFRRTLPLIDATSLAANAASARLPQDAAKRDPIFDETQLEPAPSIAQVVAASCAFPARSRPWRFSTRRHEMLPASRQKCCSAMAASSTTQVSHC